MKQVHLKLMEWRLSNDVKAPRLKREFPASFHRPSLPIDFYVNASEATVTVTTMVIVTTTMSTTMMKMATMKMATMSRPS